MIAWSSFVLAFAAACSLAAAGTASGYHTHFVADNCNYNAPQPTSYITRDGSATVALRARYEGYQWAGDAWSPHPQASPDTTCLSRCRRCLTLAWWPRVPWTSRDGSMQ